MCRVESTARTHWTSLGTPESLINRRLLRLDNEGTNPVEVGHSVPNSAPIIYSTTNAAPSTSSCSGTPPHSPRTSLALYVKTKGKYKEAEQLERVLTPLERVRGKTEKERDAGWWDACVESASQTLRVPSHGVEVGRWRAECVLDAGDVEGAVGDLTRLSHFLLSSTHLLTHIFHFTCFYLPPPPTLMATLKQSLHFDPDSKPGLSLRHFGKILDKSFFALNELLGKENLRAVVELLESRQEGRFVEAMRGYDGLSTWREKGRRGSPARP
ncbi:hypothetical protein BJ165DRAFT_1613474 [Panaeolus papilionaceus]|nr:hypothetical protein BJ165DRAFT_1613474 [Panaeolus papilionaceus]